MSEEKTYDVPENIAESAHINAKRYREMYQQSINDSDAFWGEQAEEFLSWSSKWDKVQDWDYNEANINWFVGGKLNVSYNCLDRHLETHMCIYIYTSTKSHTRYRWTDSLRHIETDTQMDR